MDFLVDGFRNPVYSFFTQRGIEMAALETRHVRIASDLAEMLGWVLFIEGGTAAEELDPLIRPEIVRRYAGIKPAVDRLMKKKRQVQTAAHELGGEG